MLLVRNAEVFLQSKTESLVFSLNPLHHFYMKSLSTIFENNLQAKCLINYLTFNSNLIDLLIKIS